MVHDMAAEAAQEPRGVPVHLKNASQNGPFLKLSLVNGFLNLVTLTLYRFWGRTKVRQQLWRDTTLNGEAFEYTGKGMELFKGFLLALVVFTIPYLVVVFGAQMLPPLIGLPLLIAAVWAAYWGIGAAIWLSFRYIGSRTTWRGIRFELIGSAVDYGWMYFRYQIVNSLLAGWWTPKMDVETAQRLWGDLFYGSQRIEFDAEEARREGLYGPFALAWFGSVIGYFVIVFVGVPLLFRSDAGPPQSPDMELLVGIYALIAVIAIIVIVAFVPYRTAVVRAIARGITVGGASFRSKITWTQMLWLTVSNLILVIFSLGFLSPLAQARAFRMVINSIESEGTVDLAAATQAERGPNQAEGLADSLDVGFM